MKIRASLEFGNFETDAVDILSVKSNDIWGRYDLLYSKGGNLYFCIIEDDGKNDSKLIKRVKIANNVQFIYPNN